MLKTAALSSNGRNSLDGDPDVRGDPLGIETGISALLHRTGGGFGAVSLNISAHPNGGFCWELRCSGITRVPIIELSISEGRMPDLMSRVLVIGPP